jgi:hypothetical protein
MPGSAEPAIAGHFREDDAMRTQKLLRRKAASDYLRETHGLERAPSTLAKLAVIGGGPIFRRAGRIPLYSTDDLDSWAISLLSGPMRSTSEAAAVKPKVTESCQRQNLDTAARAEVKHTTQANAGA